ncbi:MAG: RNA polymerase subunit sigma-70 [Alphaproteobacteria bacterium HGW-Alphaproteobacteria-18]|nr:MAG: RNA polymerase subunit sigma-70 [Alphaproteobacteria bacterium HGW-Alphaproteobacteria-18]
MRMTEQNDSTGDGARFIEQLEALVPHMRAFARSLCRNNDLADDIVQDACLNAWAARDRFISGAPMKPWIFRIVRNAYAQHWRRAWRLTPLDASDAEKTLTTPGNQEWSSDFLVMQEALQHLPEKQREALVTVLAAGFSYEEAGQILGCSEGTVKSRVSRAREALVGLMTSSGSTEDSIEASSSRTDNAA